jgi:hypothetical protein
VEFSAQSGGGGVAHSSEGNVVRWEQGTCNARFKDQALKLGAKDAKEANGQKVECCTSTFVSVFIFIFRLVLSH